MKSYNLDAMRQTVGLSRPQWLRMLGAHQDADLFDRGAVTWMVAHRAERLIELYAAYQDALRTRVREEEPRAQYLVDGVPYFSTVQAARLLDVGDFHLANLRKRERIAGRKINDRAHAFSADDLINLIDTQHSGTQSQGPLSTSFIRWLEKELIGPSGLLWDVDYNGPYHHAYRSEAIAV